MIDEDLAHGRRGHGQEVRAVREVGLLLAREAEISLVQQCGRLQRVTGTLPPHVVMSQPSQLFVDQPGQLFERGPIPLAPGRQQLGHFPRAGRVDSFVSFIRVCPKFFCIPVIGFSPVRRFSGYGELLVGVNQNYKRGDSRMYRLPISLAALALLVTAAPGSIFAAEVTATYPVGATACTGSCPVQEFPVSTRTVLQR